MPWTLNSTADRMRVYSRETSLMNSSDIRWGMAPILALVVVLAACDDHEFHPPDEEERVEAAEVVFDPAMFDTVTWSDESERMEGGNVVYATTCRRCHGTLGRGDTEYARTRDLNVPSLVAADWPLGDSLEAVRHRIFVGHSGGMPTFALSRLSARETDAVAAYIVIQLRPEVLAMDQAGPPTGD